MVVGAPHRIRCSGARRGPSGVCSILVEMAFFSGAPLTTSRK